MPATLDARGNIGRMDEPRDTGGEDSVRLRIFSFQSRPNFKRTTGSGDMRSETPPHAARLSMHEDGPNRFCLSCGDQIVVRDMVASREVVERLVASWNALLELPACALANGTTLARMYVMAKQEADVLRLAVAGVSPSQRC